MNVVFDIITFLVECFFLFFFFSPQNAMMAHKHSKRTRIPPAHPGSMTACNFFVVTSVKAHHSPRLGRALLAAVVILRICSLRIEYDLIREGIGFGRKYLGNVIFVVDDMRHDLAGRFAQRLRHSSTYSCSFCTPPSGLEDACVMPGKQATIRCSRI